MCKLQTTKVTNSTTAVYKVLGETSFPCIIAADETLLFVLLLRVYVHTFIYTYIHPYMYTYINTKKREEV